MTEEKEIVVNGVTFVHKSRQKEISGEYVIIRSYSAGVFFGVIKKRDDPHRFVVMKEATRIHYWSEGTAGSISQIAMDGLKHYKGCRLAVPVYNNTIFEVVEIIPCSEKAVKNIKECPLWKF